MRVLALFFLLVLAGCASSPNTGGSTGGQAVITQEQIAGTGASTLYDAVRMLHREWLPRRQGSFIIVADQNHLIWGRIRAEDSREDLSRNVGLSRFMQEGGVQGVYEVESISATQAGRFWVDVVGDRDFDGAIIVWTRPRG